MITLLIAAISVTVSCSPKRMSDMTPILDVTKTYPSKTLILQDIADVEYLPLETRDGFQMDFSPVDYMDDEIIITHNRVGDVMFFDRKTGKGTSSFNRTGRGPGEYTGISIIAIDRMANEMFVTVNSTTSGVYPIYVYDFEGKPLRTLLFDSQKFSFPQYLHNYDAGHLLFYNADIKRPEIFGLISKTDTVITSLPVKLERRDKMAVSRIDEDNVQGGLTIYRSEQIMKTEDGYMISEPGVDTIYRWKASTGELTPLLASTPPFGSMEYPIGMFYTGESEDGIFLNTYERKYDFDTNQGFKSVRLMYDKREGAFYEVTIMNGDRTDEIPVLLGGYSTNLGIPPGQYVILLQSYQLFDLHEQGKLHGSLAEIAATLKEDDNPVLMIVRLR